MDHRHGAATRTGSPTRARSRAGSGARRPCAAAPSIASHAERSAWPDLTESEARNRCAPAATLGHGTRVALACRSWQSRRAAPPRTRHERRALGAALRPLNSTLAHWLTWLPACVAFASALSLLAARSGWRRWLATGLSAAALVVPWWAPNGSVLRATLALYLLWACAKVLDITRDTERRSASFRWIWMLVLHDLRRDGYARDGARPTFQPRLLLAAVATLAIAIGALHVAIFEASALAPPLHWALRLGAGLVACYFGVEGALRTFEFCYRCFGLAPPLLHEHPILSRSLAEFWGRRWNRVVGHWLFRTFYRPLALRGHPVSSVLASFGASALLHFYFTWAAIGLRWGLPMAGFFLLQVPLLLLESALGQARWPRPLRHLWTAGWLLVTSPLFIAPTLVTLEGGFR
jgi:membrane bound O-acyltransferase family protein